MMLNEESNEYNVGPFKTVEDAIEYLEKSDKTKDQVVKDDKK